MPSPESGRRNLERARANGRVKIWRPHSESQRIKAGILLLHEMQPNLSQREIARTYHVSQPRVCKVLKDVRMLGPRKALGEEAYELYRMGLEVKRQEHFEAVAHPTERSQCVSIPNPWKESSRAFEEPINCAAPIVPESAIVRDHDPAIVMEKTDETGGVHQFARTTTGEFIEVHGGTTPAPAAPTPSPANDPVAIECFYVNGVLHSQAFVPRVKIQAAPVQALDVNRWF